MGVDAEKVGEDEDARAVARIASGDAESLEGARGKRAERVLVQAGQGQSALMPACLITLLQVSDSRRM